MEIPALLVVALLFGGMILYSFGFAAFIFHALPADDAGPVIRKAFPHFYLFVIASSGVAAIMLLAVDQFAALLMALITVTTLPTRQFLMPAINHATDLGNKTRFKWLHGASVVITLVHIGISGFVLSRFVA
jgi:hypothetical protein